MVWDHEAASLSLATRTKTKKRQHRNAVSFIFVLNQPKSVIIPAGKSFAKRLASLEPS